MTRREHKIKHLHKVIPTLVALFALALPSYAVVLLDDTWADGTRDNQNPPTESAWYASVGPSLTAAPKSMTLSLDSDAVMAITYFTTNAASPVQLGVGEALTATIRLAFNGVAPANKLMGFRLGLVDFADSTPSPKRVGADQFSNSSQGNGVQGYALFQNMGETFHNLLPMGIRKRTEVADRSLLGTGGDWRSLTSDLVDTGAFSGFANDTPYTLQLALHRTGTNSLSISATWLNAESGATLSTSVTDNSATNFNFDGIVLHLGNAAQSASKITFNEVKVELGPASSAYIPPTPTSGTTNGITAEEADQHIGETNTVCGLVASARYLGKGGPTYLNFDRPYPNQTLTVMISDADRAGFTSPPEMMFNGKTVCVTGVIIDYRKKPEIVVTDPSQIVLQEAARATAVGTSTNTSQKVQTTANPH